MQDLCIPTYKNYETVNSFTAHPSDAITREAFTLKRALTASMVYVKIKRECTRFVGQKARFTVDRFYENEPLLSFRGCITMKYNYFRFIRF